MKMSDDAIDVPEKVKIAMPSNGLIVNIHTPKTVRSAARTRSV